MQTTRQRIIEVLSTGEFGARALSQMLGVHEKEVVAHLDHISRSVRSRDRKFTVTPARCLGCGYVFESRGRFTSPGRCPRCRGEHIEDPRYRIAKGR
jgi:transcriptional regulator